jgi:hypothetical protein
MPRGGPIIPSLGTGPSQRLKVFSKKKKKNLEKNF